MRQLDNPAFNEKRDTLQILIRERISRDACINIAYQWEILTPT